jgi:putative FmdB family regulatory protein
MPIYVYRCECGERFERLVGLDAPVPGCPACGGTPQKIPAGPSLLGQAGTGLAKEQMPQTWRGTYNGDREYVTGLRRQWDQRQRLEAKHPELAGDQRPIIAHEGRFHGAPLRAGDPVPGHGHGHGHAPEKDSDGGSGKPRSGPTKP